MKHTVAAIIAGNKSPDGTFEEPGVANGIAPAALLVDLCTQSPPRRRVPFPVFKFVKKTGVGLWFSKGQVLIFPKSGFGVVRGGGKAGKKDADR